MNLVKVSIRRNKICLDVDAEFWVLFLAQDKQVMEHARSYEKL
jgi:hypothetical protein